MHWNLEFDLGKGDLYQYWNTGVSYSLTLTDLFYLIDFYLTETFTKPSVLPFGKDRGK